MTQIHPGRRREMSLEQRVKDVVKSASVLGREFDDHVLARMLQADVTPEVREAERAQIWTEVR